MKKSKKALNYKRSAIWAITVAVIAVGSVAVGTLVNLKAEAKYEISTEKVSSVVYNNSQYGFRFSLPQNWKGYTIVTGKWEGFDQQSGKTVETGPILSIRNPLWTIQKPRQDIPIMIFTLNQWNELMHEKFHIGAAPIGPAELGRNSQYVFALPARYNYAFLPGFEEVEKILAGNPLQPVENNK